MSVKYTRVDWQDAPSVDTPVNAANLNHMDNGILLLSEEYDTDVPLMKRQIVDLQSNLEEYVVQNAGPIVSEWLDEHVTPGGSTVVIDDTLTIQGAAADAKKTGDEVSALKEDLSTSLRTRFSTTPRTISANDIIENIAFYANTSYVSDLPVNKNGFFLSFRIASTDYRLQIFYDFNGGKIYWRTKGNVWLNWHAVGDDASLETLLSQTVRAGYSHTEDVNSINTNSVFYATQSFNANLPTKGNGMLRTTIQRDGAYGLQEFFDFRNHVFSWRLKGTNGWLTWNKHYFESDFYYRSGIIKQKLAYNSLGLGTMHQDIAVYNGKMFALRRYDNNPLIRVYDLSTKTYTDYPANFGHGNGIVFGKTIADNSDFPFIYISGWDDNTVYVYKFTGEAFTLERTITLPISGYTTCAVDDINNVVYIFSLDVYPTVVKPYLFTAWDYSKDAIVHQQYTEPFETMQGIDLTDGVITVASGYNTETSGKYIRTYDLRGNKIGEYFGHPFTGTTEPEGFSIDPITGKVYMSSISEAYEVEMA